MRNPLLLVGLMAWVVTARAEPVEWPVGEGGNGHFYEVVGGMGTVYDGVTWVEADALAKARSHEGVNGHLATVTSLAEHAFVYQLPEVVWSPLEEDPAALLHVGGWSVVTAVIDPQPWSAPYVETTGEEWVTGEDGTLEVFPSALVTGPVGEVLFFRWGTYSLDGMGYPDYGVYAAAGPSTAFGFLVEYDGLDSDNYPGGVIPTTEMSWGGVKSLYR